MNKHRGSDFNEFLIEQGLTNTDQPMTPTPRTDEAADRFPQPGQPPGAQWPEIVPADFARQLERENQTFRAAQKACEDCDAPRVDRIAELERELAEVTQSLAFQTQLNREVIEREKQTHADLAAERELADRLAETLANVQGDYASTGAITTQAVAESLDAWREARHGTR